MEWSGKEWRVEVDKHEHGQRDVDEVEAGPARHARDDHERREHAVLLGAVVTALDGHLLVQPPDLVEGGG